MQDFNLFKVPFINGMYKEDEDQTCQSAYVFASCEDWWTVGVRFDGIVAINYNIGGRNLSHTLLVAKHVLSKHWKLDSLHFSANKNQN
jgi:hypothetical protein